MKLGGGGITVVFVYNILFSNLEFAVGFSSLKPTSTLQ